MTSKAGSWLPNLTEIVAGAGVQESTVQASLPMSGSYPLSKAALNASVRLLAPALAEKGVAVVAVCPGWCR